MSIQHDGKQTHAPADQKSTGLETSVSGPETTDIHEILSSERRYLVIKYLVENQPCTLPELAEYVASELENETVDRTHDSYQKYRVSLYQTHLDKLAQHDVIRFTDKSSEITLGENAGRVVEQMPEVSLDGDSWMTTLTDWF